MDLLDRIKYAEMKARHKDILRPWYKKWWGVALLILSGIIFIALALCSAYIISKAEEILAKQNQEDNFTNYDEYINAVSGDGTNYYLGASSSPITLIEFGDFACPYCKDSASVVRNLGKNYTGQLKIVWRDYLRNEDSIELAVSARCAGAQDKFWEMHDLLFANQETLATSSAERTTALIKLADNLGLDKEKFTSCLENRDNVEQVKKDYNDANKIQIAGTPAWFIKGYAFAGFISEEKFNDLINGLIKKNIK